MGNNLKAMRERAGYRSISEFAARMGVTRPAASMWESGARELSLDRACDICDVLHCTLDELAGRSVNCLSDDERSLLSMFRSTDARGQAMILSIARANQKTSPVSVEESVVFYANSR